METVDRRGDSETVGFLTRWLVLSLHLGRTRARQQGRETETKEGRGRADGQAKGVALTRMSGNHRWVWPPTNGRRHGWRSGQDRQKAQRI